MSEKLSACYRIFVMWRRSLLMTYSSDIEHIIISSLPDFFHFDGQIFLWMYLDTPSVLVLYQIFPFLD